MLEQIEIDKMVSSLVSEEPTNLIDDCKQDLYLFIYELLDKIKGTDKETFNYVYTSASFELGHLRRQYVGYEEELEDNSLPVEFETQKRIEDTVEYNLLLDELTPIEKEIIEARYQEDLTEEEIVNLYQDVLGIGSTSGVSRYLNRIINKLS